jgi:hypothetical protein
MVSISYLLNYVIKKSILLSDPVDNIATVPNYGFNHKHEVIHDDSIAHEEVLYKSPILTTTTSTTDVSTIGKDDTKKTSKKNLFYSQS